MLDNRIGWAVFYMKKAGLVRSEKGAVSITDEGRKTLEENPEGIDRKYLMTVPRYREYHDSMTGRRGKRADDEGAEISEQTPEDMLRSGHGMIRRTVESELLEKIKKNTPSFFETLVLELIRKMGYGIDHRVLGRTRDGGIDGVIREDRLGFNEIYFQAKRWDSTVPIHQVRDFAGALLSKKSKKGIFITSSDFSKDAYEFVKTIDSKIILVNGDKLAEYMYECDLGVSVEDAFEIKKVDEDYFSDG